MANTSARTIFGYLSQRWNGLPDELKQRELQSL